MCNEKAGGNKVDLLSLNIEYRFAIFRKLIHPVMPKG
jgi:hypothetical protein